MVVVVIQQIDLFVVLCARFRPWDRRDRMLSPLSRVRLGFSVPGRMDG